MLQKKLLLVLVPLLLVFSFYLFSMDKKSNKIYKEIHTVHGQSFGFYIGHNGYFLTNYEITKGLVQGNIKRLEKVKENAIAINVFPLKGYSIFKSKMKIREKIYELGDSDTVDIGDFIYLPDSGKGKILYKLNNFNEYHFPCFIGDFQYSKTDVGKPVLNFAHQVIGLFINYKDNYLIVPINRIKPHLEQVIKKDASVSMPGFEKNKNTQEKMATNSKESKDKKIKANPEVLAPQYGGHPEYQFGSITEIDFDRKNNLYIIDGYYNELKKISLSGLLKEFSHPQKPKPKKVVIDKKKDAKDKPKKNLSDKNKDKASTKGTTKIKGTTKAKSDKNDKAQNNSDKMIEKPMPIPVVKKKVSLKNPVSLSVSDAGLIHVLDHGSRKIIIFNEDLNIVYEMKYDKISSLFKPVKVRTFGDEIFIISDTMRLYHLKYQKRTGDIIATELKLSGKKWSTIGLIDMTSDNDNLYLLDQKHSQVLVMSKNRKLINRFSIKGKFPTSISTHQGKVFIFDRENKKTAIYSKEGQFIRFWSGSILNNHGNPSLLKVGFSGIVASVYDNYSHIRLFQLDGKPIKTLSSFSNKEQELESPVSISTDSLNRLIVVSGNPGIFLYPFAKDTALPKELKYLLKKDLKPAFRGITTGSKGKIFIADTYKDRLLMFPRIPYPEVIAFSGKELGELSQPIQLAYSKGLVYIADKENNRIVVINEKGILQKTFVTRDKDSHLLFPQDLTVNSKGEVFVLAENKVLKFDSHSKLTSEFIIKKGNNSYIGYAKGIVSDGETIYIADTYNNRILRYDGAGEFLGEFGTLGGGLDNLNQPWDLHVSNHDLFVTDKGNHRIVRYSYGRDEEKSKDKMEKGEMKKESLMKSIDKSN